VGEATTLTSPLETAQRLVPILVAEGYGLKLAAWTMTGDDKWRLLLVPDHAFEGNLKETVKVAYVISKHRDELPGRHDLQFELVEETDPRAVAIRAAARGLRPLPREIASVHHGAAYIERAFVLKAA
jgi:hypothetical protein